VVRGTPLVRRGRGPRLLLALQHIAVSTATPKRDPHFADGIRNFADGAHNFPRWDPNLPEGTRTSQMGPYLAKGPHVHRTGIPGSFRCHLKGADGQSRCL
jgi:hypothetical protein